MRACPGLGEEPFDKVKNAGLALPGVEVATRYDGSPVLKVGGAFMAGLATHASADHDTLVVRAKLEDRQYLLEDAPEIYYLTGYCERYPLVLARLSKLDDAALRDLLAVSRRLTLKKGGRV